MSSAAEGQPSGSAQPGRFATTHWSLVLCAGRGGPRQASSALATLCENYWLPLYAFVRREGYASHDAQDLTQEFFARLLEKNYLAVADRRRGRFRSFLLAAMKHFLANQRRRTRAQKRGGRQSVLSWDFQAAENQYNLAAAENLTPERLYEKRWALSLLDLVLRRLREEYGAAGKSRLFDRLKQFLSGEEALQSYGQVAAELEMTEGAVKVAVHRLRRRYRELLREEIAQTVATPEEFEDELRHLFTALAAR